MNDPQSINLDHATPSSSFIRPANFSLKGLFDFVSAHALLSFRGLILAIFTAFLLFEPVPNQADIVATVMAFSFLSLLILVLLISLVNGLIIKRNLNVEILLPAKQDNFDSADKMISGQKAQILIKLSKVRICPLFLLSLKIEFENQGLFSLTHQLADLSNDTNYINDTLRFPHRGKWQSLGVTLSFGDQLGLSLFKWKLSDALVSKCFVVHPPPSIEAQLPIISSSDIAGDMVFDINEKKGDPFDLKPYHPSDGIKKILWKIYAKTGEVISRHPEQSMTPEGEVVLFVLASEHDDALCSKVNAYVDKLDELDLDIFLGCEGMTSRSVAQSPPSAKALLIDSVWDTKKTTKDSLHGELDSLVSTSKKQLVHGSISQILVFTAFDRLQSDEMLSLYISVGNYLEALGIKPIFCLLKDTTKLPQDSSKQALRPDGLTTKAFGLLVEKDKTPQEPSMVYYNAFMDLCLKNNWRVL